MYSLRAIIDILLLPFIIAVVVTLLLYVIYRNTVKKAIINKYNQNHPNKVTIFTIITIILLLFCFSGTAFGLSLYNLHQIKVDMSYITGNTEEDSEQEEIRYFDIFGNEYEYAHKIILYDENGIAYHQSDDNLKSRYIGNNGKAFFISNAYLNQGGCLVCFNIDIEEDVEYTDNSYEIITADGEHLYWALGCYWDIDGNLIINSDGGDKKIVITKEKQEQYQLENSIFLKNQISD